MDVLMISNFTNSKTKTYSFNEPEILTNFNHTLKVITCKINKLKKKKKIRMDTLESICCFKEYMFYDMLPRRVRWYVNILACKARLYAYRLVAISRLKFWQVRTQNTLVNWHISTQNTLACWHAWHAILQTQN